ncbi:unnamed protein product [Arabis nemorensis]|uniref:F-box domain-containing protein n=1 Tax=Arabis nemorensis TaxID=586526 RepID=A0A565BU44_9BRAS|nr:unnamed protein product [Arabis nemorensis]
MMEFGNRRRSKEDTWFINRAHVHEVRRKDMTSNQRPFTLEQASREIKRRRRREREKILIPNDIVEEILVRLPVISLIRFQTVSKHWESLVSSRDFGERYMSHQKTKDPKLFFICDDLVNRSRNTLFIQTMTTTLKETMTASLEHRESLEFEEFRGFLQISESCDGLVCIYGMTIPLELMNPASGMSISLPLARIQRLHIDYPNPDLVLVTGPDPEPAGQFYGFTRFGFGKDGVTGRYKLVM